jgi:hypothetical protein
MKSAKMQDPWTNTSKLSTIPSGCRNVASTSLTVFEVGERAGYPNLSNILLDMRLTLAPRSQRSFLIF